MDDPTPVRSRFRELVREAHRRSLWQVLGLYLVGCWIGYEVILALFEGLGLPGWVPGLAIVLFIIGLPVVVATAFVQEGIPGGGREEPAGSREEPAGSRERPAGGRAEPGDRPPEPRGRIPEPGDAADAGDPVAAAGGPGRARARLLTWSGVATAGILAFAALGLAATGFMGMRALGIGPVGTLVAKGELEAREPLVVAEFEPLSGDSSLAAVVTEGLRADLAQSQYVTVLDRARVRETLQRMLRPTDARLDPETAREVALRSGLKAVVEGEVGRAGAGWLLTARVVTADSARTLAALRETAADSTELVSAIESLSRALRERVGESLRTVRASAPLAQVTTPSLPALRKAAEAMREEVAANRPRSIRLLNEAVELDPGFATAWHMLAVAHYNDNRREATLEAIERALEHEDRLDDARRHRARAFYASITGDHRTAYQEELEVAALRPDDPVPYVSLSDLAWHLGDWEDAEARARRALALDYQGWVAHWNLVVALLDGGKVAEARQAVEEARADLPAGHDIPLQLEDMTLVAEGRWDSVAAGSRPFRAALAERTMGQWSAAYARLRELGGRMSQRAWWLSQWDRLLVLGDPDAADAIEEVIDTLDSAAGVPERAVAEVAVALAMVGRVEAALQVRGIYEARVPEAVRWSDGYLLTATDAFIALHEGRTEEAIAGLRRARQSTPWTAPVDAFLGRAWDTMGRPDSATAAYTRYVESPWAYRIGFFHELSDPVLLVPAHERLAYLHEEAGDLAAAAHHASIVIRLWDDADPILQPRVAAVRRILERAVAETR